MLLKSSDLGTPAYTDTHTHAHVNTHTCIITNSVHPRPRTVLVGKEKRRGRVYVGRSTPVGTRERGSMFVSGGGCI